ncbi:hypothetical protein BV20DRAFT_19187 [Pilatotrama ljubarskyi]|nr:hypothetical protein BV20DRAFT_19187 [Pilatotrama ljubarskyi]
MSSNSSASSVSSSLLDGRPDKATAGPILVQGFLQYLCQGVIISQGAKFFHRWDDDPVGLRVYVAALLFFSLVQTVLESYKTWVETIVGKHWWSSRLHFTEFLCNALICSLCEAFLIRRCYRISQRNLSVLAFLCALLITTTIASVILTIRIAKDIGPFADHGNADPLHASLFAYPLWVYGTLVMAVSITTILSVSLWRNRTGLRHLDRTLNHIIFITFESAALPTACTLASAIIYSIRDARASEAAAAAASSHGGTGQPESTSAEMSGQALHLDLFFAILTGKVYTLGLLRTLNSRTQFRAGLHTSNLGRRSLTGWECPEAGGAAGRASVEARAGAGADADARCPCPHSCQTGRVRGRTVSVGSGCGGWAGAGGAVGQRGSSCAGRLEERDHAYDRSSEETVRAGSVDAAAYGGGRLSAQSDPSSERMTPKVRQSSSKGSTCTPECGGTCHCPP